MSLACYMLVSFLFLFQIHLLSAEEFEAFSECLFTCGKLGTLSFPFSNTTHSKCSVCVLNCTDDEPKVQFRKQGKWYPVNDINYSVKRIQIHDQDVQSHLESNHCD
ncbi:non-specific serine/threonine protein kinase [Ranunculus cassubicifolius]